MTGEPGTVEWTDGRDGREAASTRRPEPHRRELPAHRNPMTVSLEDAQDLVQETFVRARRNRAGFQGRASSRAQGPDAVRSGDGRLPEVVTFAPSGFARCGPPPVR